MSHGKPAITEPSILYLYLDGDGVGDVLELALINNHPAEAASYSRKITECMQKIENLMHSTAGASVVFVGGDEILVTIPAVAIQQGLAMNLQRIFVASTGTTASVGIGRTSSEAALNLRRSKLQGKNSIVGPRGALVSEQGEAHLSG